MEALADFFGRRLTQQDESVDGVLAWNLLDFLDPKAAQALAARLTRILRPDGALLGFFGTLATPDSRFTKYVIVDEENLRQRPYASGGKRQTALQNRDIIKLFDGLRVSESFLLKTNVRETLFRKPRLAAARR
jgi:predicted SAM-dependent methyltransferase